jgi:class 3 adenylate cyclase
MASTDAYHERRGSIAAAGKCRRTRGFVRGLAGGPPANLGRRYAGLMSSRSPATLLMCDVVDSTKLLERLGDARGVALLDRFYAAARELLGVSGDRGVYPVVEW